MGHIYWIWTFFVLVFLFTQHKQNLHTVHVHFSNISWPNFKVPDLKFPLHRMAEMFIWTELCWCISLKKRQNKNASSRIILTKYVSWPLRVPDTSSVLEFFATRPHHQEGFALRPRSLRGRVGLIFHKLNIEWRSQIFRLFWTEKFASISDNSNPNTTRWAKLKILFYFHLNEHGKLVKFSIFVNIGQTFKNKKMNKKKIKTKWRKTYEVKREC